MHCQTLVEWALMISVVFTLAFKCVPPPIFQDLSAMMNNSYVMHILKLYNVYDTTAYSFTMNLSYMSEIYQKITKPYRFYITGDGYYASFKMVRPLCIHLFYGMYN